jgi:3,4-dihydroxy 2-butanone 4-phosphate synthase/GTP cyclohydrolase II
MKKIKKSHLSDTPNKLEAISKIEEIIEEARNGRMFILADDEDRENEGDLIIPAQMSTPEAINFMATYGRGLICLALTPEKIESLELPLMSASNSSRHETAFTVSIEAKEGVTTGISAHDRALTISTAINPLSGPNDIATPGHVFPLRAKKGGVLVRAGHTEAAVDIARLAGLNPSGVICEIMNEDGTMARMPDLTTFAQYHQLKLGTISDLIAYRRRHDNLVKEIKLEMVHSAYGGDWELRTFQDQISGAEHYTLSKGKINKKESILVRMHVFNTFTDVLGIDPKRLNQINDCMLQISEQGTGVLVLLNNRSLEENKSENPPYIIRQYGIGAQILKALGVKKICLLSNSGTPKLIGIEGYGLEISDTIPIKSFKEK